jgi:hypothetical protein
MTNAEQQAFQQREREFLEQLPRSFYYFLMHDSGRSMQVIKRRIVNAMTEVATSRTEFGKENRHDALLLLRQLYDVCDYSEHRHLFISLEKTEV